MKPVPNQQPFSDQQIERKIDVARARIERVIRDYEPIAAFALFSGGHDSLAALLVSGLLEQFPPALHINTGIGVPATHSFVRQTCQARNCVLIEKCAAANCNAKGQLDPQVYADLVREWGFPGPGHHGKMYNRLKERALRSIERDAGANCRGKRKDRVLYISGCRSEESTRRMANTAEVQVDGRRIWCAPLHDWSKLDCSLAIELFKAARNPVVDLIHKSGECLCGAFANSDRDNELEELNLWDLTRPAYNEIKRLEAIVKPIHGWGWGERPPKKQQACAAPPGMLCQGCKL